MDIELFQELLKKAAPVLVPTIPIALGLVKSIVTAIRKLIPTVDGNIAQTVVAIVSVLVSIAQSVMAGIFSQGVNGPALLATGLLFVNVWLGSMGLHELFKNQNKPEPANLSGGHQGEV